MLLSILCGILICLSGLMASYFIELPSGASIILIGGALLGAIKGVKRAARRHLAEGFVAEGKGTRDG
jgi:ABC-type Mn2+/Zn2+ transport system permease subunit